MLSKSVPKCPGTEMSRIRPQTPLACSERFTVLTGNTWAPTFTPGLPDF